MGRDLRGDHPLAQFPDLVIYTTRKLLECDNGYELPL
jgi:hypothetical protein